MMKNTRRYSYYRRIEDLDLSEKYVGPRDSGKEGRLKLSLSVHPIVFD